MDVQQGSKDAGFTLVEMMVTIGIMAILATMAVPSFTEMMRNAQRRSALNDYWHAIFLARSEAIKRNSVVVICKSSDGRQCDHADTNWAHGWVVFENRDRDNPAQIDADEPVLSVSNAKSGVSISSNRPSFDFRAFAQGNVNGTIVFCDARGDASARAIIISHTGRPRESDRDASRRALHCSA